MHPGSRESGKKHGPRVAQALPLLSDSKFCNGSCSGVTAAAGEGVPAGSRDPIGNLKIASVTKKER
eukprot:1956759-Pleurochrysis_carterae.AAC.2